MFDLIEIGDDLAVYLNFHVSDIEQSDDPEIVAAAAVAVSAHYEAFGIVELLVAGNASEFFHHLIRSAQTRKWLLTKFKSNENVPASTLKASRIRPVMAAIVASQFELAREITSNSLVEWQKDWEYEDDFLYAHFLHGFVNQKPSKELHAILSRYEELLSGETSTKLNLCRLLLEPDENNASELFTDLINEREAHIKKLKETSAYWDGGDAVLVPNTLVYIEGLAWLKLIEHVGIKLGDDYMYCPSNARAATYDSFKVTTFPSLPL